MGSEIINKALGEHEDPLDLTPEDVDRVIDEAISVYFGEREDLDYPENEPDDEGYACPLEPLIHTLEWGEMNHTLRCTGCNKLYLETQCRSAIYIKGTTMQLIIDVIKDRKQIMTNIFNEKVLEYADHYKTAKSKGNQAGMQVMEDRIKVLRNMQELLGLK